MILAVKTWGKKSNKHSDFAIFNFILILFFNDFKNLCFAFFRLLSGFSFLLFLTLEFSIYSSFEIRNKFFFSKLFCSKGSEIVSVSEIILPISFLIFLYSSKSPLGLNTLKEMNLLILSYSINFFFFPLCLILL